ncbi:hypothetical protein [Ancylobacter mangrovi]|uniref:hypothetical protein n=1 Tax=Ancylobacter mangrovi TaxID=2972472 RepID=UPI0021635B6D|nr:hypothetical protein [Ancylobacter mangrovi]MCS0502291.1 hypothetical protein [Ancylobacter mangrovi]
MRRFCQTFVPSSRLTHLRAGLLAVLLALAGLVAAGTADRADAALATPALAAPAAATSLLDTPAPLAEPVHWVCGPWRCVWRPNYPAYWYVPRYARGWGPPVRPNCYWTRRWGGAWVHVCP